MESMKAKEILDHGHCGSAPAGLNTTEKRESNVLPNATKHGSESKRMESSDVARIFRRSPHNETERSPPSSSFYEPYHRPPYHHSTSKARLAGGPTSMPHSIGRTRHFVPEHPSPHHPPPYTSYPYPNPYGSATNYYDGRSHGYHQMDGRVGESTGSFFPGPMTPLLHEHNTPPWNVSKPTEHILDIQPNDVLSGRGGATNSHSGNRAFRSLVKQFQDRYLKAKKRDKPAVAAIVVERIREKGGRFLKRVSTTPDGRVIWIDIGDTRAKEKACQALREGAPEIRRKRKVSSSVDEDDQKDSKTDISPSQSFLGQSTSNEETPPNAIVTIQHEPQSDGWVQPVSHQNPLPIVIRPSPLLLRHRVPEPIVVDQLSHEEREIYLRDFLPPDPAIRKRVDNTYLYAQHSVAGNYHDADSRPGRWKITPV